MNTMRRHIWCLSAIACALFLLVTACDQGPREPPTETEQCRAAAGEVILPLAEGNYWIRSHPHFDGEGNVEDPQLTDTSRIEVEERLPVTVGGTTYTAAVLRWTQGGFTDDFAELFWNGPAGTYALGMVAPDDTMVVEPNLRYKYPVAVGETWRVFNFEYTPRGEGITIVDTLTYRAVRTGERFVTPADTFETVVYHYFYDQGFDILDYAHYFEYYVSGIGHVGTRVYTIPDTTLPYRERSDEDLAFGTTLLEYCLK